ncbi:NAD(P)-dependent oxidoreductase [Mucilaginibacter sp. CAU 1740]|uniref:NAD(P)-dependent oxidoreductase n=1 Tax=Mucilaginibacter sp. CAU 1740 TaxID=3140365 RepID=UPI00325BA46B
MNTTKTGWIGLGNMGIPMSQQLIKAGYPLSVYNRSKDKEEGFKAQGIGTAASPLLLIKDVDVVFIMVSDDKAISDIFYGEAGLLAADVNEKVIINMSTVSPAISREIAAACKKQGNHYLDAPVSGSVKQAEDGVLVIMVGGEAEAFDKVKPILEKLGKLALLVGGAGAGNTAKLAINTLLGIVAQGFAETVALAGKNGIQPEILTNLINNSALGSPFIKIKGDAIVNNNFNAAFALKHITKDLRLATEIGADTPLAQAAYQTYQNAEAALGEEDIIAVIKQFR